MSTDSLLTLRARIDDALAAGTSVLLALDGPAASGKSTLARRLSQDYSAPIIAMDDFFLPQDRRTEARLSEPGGNLDYERFLEEVVPGLRSGATFSYHHFDCFLQTCTEQIEVPAAPLRILEGSYSHHPLWSDLLTIKCFLRLTPEEQYQRILARNGSSAAAVFARQWIPLENLYFSSFHISENADILL